MAVYSLTNLDEWHFKNRETFKKVVAGVVLDMGGRIIRRTPVDTGRARGNWNFSLDRPDTSVDPNKKKKNRVLRKSELPDIDGKHTIFIVNNLDYIVELEKGSSTQAPKGMVEVTRQEWQRVLDANARKFRGF